MITISSLKITPTSLVSKSDLQRVVFEYECDRAAHLCLNVYREGVPVVRQVPLVLTSGCGLSDVMLPVQEEQFDALWELTDKKGEVVFSTTSLWKKPREWTLYVMVSSHTDIGLHNSQYIQRYNSSRFIDEAARLCDETENEAPENRYRYTMEGTWFFGNYGRDRGREAAERIVRDYVKTGRIGVCAGLAGNHIETYGLEEMCRSAYERRRLEDEWGVSSETLSMIDMNGLPWSMIDAYADAGYKNIFFCPNHWNPIPSQTFTRDLYEPGCKWNPNAGGGPSRVDVRYDSALPMVFNWESRSGAKLTVWASTHYSFGGSAFGIFPNKKRTPEGAILALNDGKTSAIEWRMQRQLERLEKRYPFDFWLFGCYEDDQAPDRYVLGQIELWNSEWRWPRLSTLGNPDEPFRRLRERFGDSIPTLRGDITGGWYQHPLTVPELMADKFDADRALPTAEKWATVAGMIDDAYAYPATDLRRAWDALLMNDEHSYGTSGYKGRRVCETWMQHRDWIESARETAERERRLALRTIASHVRAEEASLVVFNPTAVERREYVETADGGAHTVVTVPAFGYRAIPLRTITPSERTSVPSDEPPVVENDYYRLAFSENGSISSIYDKALARELLDAEAGYGANEPIYTRDNHETYLTPKRATFEIVTENGRITVVAKTEIEPLGAEIVQRVTLPNEEKRIEIDNRLCHVRDMINEDRYKRYLYYAFPFLVEDCRRLCHLNGVVAEYARDLTGHGTDVYMAVNEWCCSENDDLGVALLMKDAFVVEFDRIHPDKTDFGDVGEGSGIFSYAANDWLQKHCSGGSRLDFRFRYAIVSYTGGYEGAGIPAIAERYVNPLDTVEIPAQEGDLPPLSHRFLALPETHRFVCLKRADDGRGVIARLYGGGEEASFEPALCAEPSTVDERPSPACAVGNFRTYRLLGNTVRLKTREPDEPARAKNTPAPIGSRYTGLITRPRAAAGENMGHLYLLWGANTEEDLSHYRLYRSTAPGFVPSEENFVADVPPEEYVVGRYEDTGLETNVCYYYRVCAVNTSGVCGEMSEEFSAYTREEIG